MNFDENYVVLSPELLYSAGSEMIRQSNVMQENLNRISEIMEQTSKELPSNEELYKKVQDDNIKMMKLYNAMVGFGNLLVKVGKEWKTLKDSGELDKLINELGVE